MRIKMENFINDFGVTALITKVLDAKEYIFLNEDNYISDISQYLFEDVFKNSYTLSKLFLCFFHKINYLLNNRLD